MAQIFYWPKKNFQPIFFFRNNFFFQPQKIIWLKKKYWLKNFLIKFFSDQIFCRPKIFFTKKIIWLKRKFWLKKIFGWKNFQSKKFQLQKFSVEKNQAKRFITSNTFHLLLNWNYILGFEYPQLLLLHTTVPIWCLPRFHVPEIPCVPNVP